VVIAERRLRPDDHLFAGRRGGVMHPNNSRKRIWVPAVVDAGLQDPLPTRHALRHGAVAIWIAAGEVDRTSWLVGLRIGIRPPFTRCMATWFRQDDSRAALQRFFPLSADAMGPRHACVVAAVQATIQGEVRSHCPTFSEDAVGKV